MFTLLKIWFLWVIVFPTLLGLVVYALFGLAYGLWMVYARIATALRGKS